MSRRSRNLLLLLLAFVALSLTACLPGDGKNSVVHPAGFWTGIWHGWVAPVSLIVGLFKHGVRVYEEHNTGWWYDLGFYIAIIAGFGGIAITRSRNKR
jgi:hypothetical protein